MDCSDSHQHGDSMASTVRQRQRCAVFSSQHSAMSGSPAVAVFQHGNTVFIRRHMTYLEARPQRDPAIEQRQRDRRQGITQGES